MPYFYDTSGRMESMEQEARGWLDKARAILRHETVTDKDAAIADGYTAKANEIITRADALKKVLIAAEKADVAKEWNAGNGAGKGEVKKMNEKDSGGFGDLGDFFSAVLKQSKGFRDDRLVMATKDMAEGAGVSGGYMVPAGHANEVYSLAAERSIVEVRAHVFDIPGRDISLPALDQYGSVAGKPNFWGMVEMEWTDEGGQKPLTEPLFKEIKLVLHGLKGFAIVNDELLDDSNPSISAFLQGQLVGATSWWKDRSYLMGNGVGQPLGIVGAPGTYTQVRVVAGAFEYLDAVNMLSHFKPVNGGCWILHQTVMPDVFAMQDPGNNYIWHPGSGLGGVAGPAPGTLLGYPVHFTENLPPLGTTGDVLLCDLSQYYIARNKGIVVDVSREHLFRTDKTCFRVVSRVDGQPAVQATILLADGATQMSPFVELSAATS